MTLVRSVVHSRVKPVLYGAIEGGGTKFVCAVGRSATDVHESLGVSTFNPDPTLRACVDFFASAEHELGRLNALGFRCFGPLDLRTESST